MYGSNENSLLYTYVELSHLALAPLRIQIKAKQDFYQNSFNPLHYTDLGQNMGAYWEVFDRIIKRYNRPEFEIKQAIVNNERYKITEEIILEKTFCNLLHFKKDKDLKQQKLLLVAPMSGHYPTLLRGTVTDLLPFYDIYITEWVNPRDVPVTKGDFHFSDYVHYCIEFMEKLAPNLTIMGICQPTVPVLAAVSYMYATHNNKKPENMILVGGPIDARESPTSINSFATEQPMEWFEKYLITRVPYNFDGYMRRVYPGFLQLSGFMSMNMQRHIGEHIKLFDHLVDGDGESVESHKKFYDEYLSVMDMTAEFYLETIDLVFKKYALPNKTMRINNVLIDPALITDTKLLCIEGEKDDISGVGQTEAAIALCSGISKQNKLNYLQKDVGHYGTFNGRRFREGIIPQIRKFTGN